MKQVEEFLAYIIENIDDPRIYISKKVKYGYRHYVINIGIPTKNNRDITIIIDLRNHTIEFGYDYGFNLVIESEELSKKWGDIFENHYSKNLDEKFQDILDSFISETNKEGKDFWRDWTMNKIFTNKKGLKSKKF